MTKDQLAEAIADYVQTHERWEYMTKREAVIAAVNVLTKDIGAAQAYVDAIGMDVDLYAAGAP